MKVEIIKEFANTEGDAITKALLGEIVEVKLKFRSLGDDILNNMVIVDCLPAGFETVTDRKTHLRYKPDYVDTREDRIICYGACTKNMSEYIYWIKAVNEGEYIVPPAFIENMYDNSIFGITPFKEKLIVQSENQ